MVNVPAANTAYKAGVEQLQAGGRYFLNGAMDSYKVATTENLAQAIDVELIPVDGKDGYFYLKCHIGETVKYGKVAANGNNVNFTYENNPETEWSLYELEGKGGQKTIVTNVTGCDNANKNGLSYLGTFGTGTSLTVSRTSYIEGETNAPKIDAATNGQYPLHFYTVE